MRIVGNKNWNPISTSPEEAMRRGVKLDAMMKSLGIPDFQPKGVFRGTQSMFDAMDEERAKKVREWVNEHTRST
ncbi:MAG: hypothetical protein ACOH1I_11640 [Gallionellaceae bacterium]|jgi:hypothetical protein